MQDIQVSSGTWISRDTDAPATFAITAAPLVTIGNSRGKKIKRSRIFD